ncbi:MAG: T9SS type A sorting domain-containing protein [Aureispira sp.]|nr:T9SS type A sorting domain-containing protein [Aureispira sp.]
MKTLLFALAMVAGFNTAMFATEDKMVMVVLTMDNEDDAQIIATMHTTMMAAEKVAQVLEIEMTADDEVNDDVFVFSLKSEDQKDIAIQMFDEEGYEIQANREVQVENGNNYNALNVKSMDDGTYIFKLTDESGAELTKKVTIKRD